MNRFNETAALLIFLFGCATSTYGQGPQAGGLDIHGFGEWAYGSTDGNAYLVGSDDGRYENASLSLNLSYRHGDRLAIIGQIRTAQNDVVSEDDIEVSLEYAFVEWTFSEALRLRVGRAKHPFGVYAEVFDVGTLRPFYYLPQSIYGAIGYTARFYDGLGITGSRELGAWSLDYDVYGGQIQGDLTLPGALTGNPAEVLEPIVDTGFTVTDVLGGRPTLSTPIDGLSFGLSGYRGEEKPSSSARVVRDSAPTIARSIS